MNGQNFQSMARERVAISDIKITNIFVRTMMMMMMVVVMRCLRGRDATRARTRAVFAMFHVRRYESFNALVGNICTTLQRDVSERTVLANSSENNVVDI